MITVIDFLTDLPSTSLLLVAAALAGVGLARSRRALTRPARFRPGSTVSAETQNAPRMITLQMQSDALGSRLRSLLSRSARLSPVVDQRERAFETLEQHRTRCLTRLESAIDNAREQAEPVLTARSATLLRVLAFSGDVMVVSAAIQAAEAETSPLQALVLSLAVSVSLFLLGDFVGHQLLDREQDHARGLLVLTVAGLTALSLALFFLRESSHEAWIVLALCPAVGAALIVVLGPSPLQWQVERTNRQLLRLERRLRRRDARLSHLQGRLAWLDERARCLLRRDTLAVSAEAARTGAIEDPVHDWDELAGRTGLPLFGDTPSTPARHPLQLHRIPSAPQRPIEQGLDLTEEPSVVLNGNGNHPVEDFR